MLANVAQNYVIRKLTVLFIRRIVSLSCLLKCSRLYTNTNSHTHINLTLTSRTLLVPTTCICGRRISHRMNSDGFCVYLIQVRICNAGALCFLTDRNSVLIITAICSISHPLITAVEFKKNAF